MTQSDAEGDRGPNSAEVSQPPAEASQPPTKSEKDVTDYHGQLLDQLRHVEDTINKFEIQNYAASGAVVLAYLADRAPLHHYHSGIAQHKLCHSDLRPGCAS